MANYAIRTTMPSAKPAAPKPQNKSTPPVTQKTLDRAARVQGIEAKESLLLKRGRPDVIRTTVAERTTPTKKDR